MKLSLPPADLLATAPAVPAPGGETDGTLTAADGRLVVECVGTEGGNRVTVPCPGVTRLGTARVCLATLFAAVRAASGEAVELDVVSRPGWLVMRTASSRFEFPTRDTAGIPVWVNEPDAAARVTVPGAAFRGAVNRVAFAADRREQPERWATTGILFRASAGSLELSATDTHRYAVETVPTLEPAAPPSALVPAAAVRRWAVVGGVDPVTLSLSGRHAAFSAGPVEGWSALVAGAMPPHDRVAKTLSEKRPHALELPPPELLAAVSQALVVSEEGVDADWRVVTLSVAAKRLTVRAESESGAARVEVAIPGYKGERFEVRLNGHHLREYLRAVASEDSVTVRWNVAGRPVLFEVGTGRHLMMPLVGSD